MKLRDLLGEMSKIAATNKLSTPFIVGGAPRDKFLGKLEEISDIDITTGDASIEYLVKEMGVFLGKSYNFRLKKMPTGYTTLTLGNLKMDFSSNFLIPNIDQMLLHMNIKNPTNMQKELFSRDFTCNTLLLSMNLKEILDETHLAIPDLNRKIIKTCLSPEITLTTNKNRVVRSIYLASKLDFDIDNDIIEFVKQHPETIRFASDHTMREKLDKAMDFDPDKTIHYLDQMNVWPYIPITQKLYPAYMKRQGK
jgi:tRNA nucleotidyltransferase/poly(A) polymerase